jgi:hypothetical protein
MYRRIADHFSEKTHHLRLVQGAAGLKGRGLQERSYLFAAHQILKSRVKSVIPPSFSSADPGNTGPKKRYKRISNPSFYGTEPFAGRSTWVWQRICNPPSQVHSPNEIRHPLI